MKKIFIFFLIAALFGLCACGKSARPVPFENSGYPHSYPSNTSD